VGALSRTVLAPERDVMRCPDLEDGGDLPVTRFQPDPRHRKQQSVGTGTAVATQVAGRVEANL